MWKLCIYPWKQKLKVTRYERSVNKAYCRHRYFPHSWLSISPLASTQFILCVLQLPLSNSLLYSLKTIVFTCSFALPHNPAYISFNHQPLFLLLQTLLLFLVSRIYKKTHTHTHTWSINPASECTFKELKLGLKTCTLVPTAASVFKLTTCGTNASIHWTERSKMSSVGVCKWNILNLKGGKFRHNALRHHAKWSKSVTKHKHCIISLA